VGGAFVRRGLSYRGVDLGAAPPLGVARLGTGCHLRGQSRIGLAGLGDLA